jgi:hypothetical protein
VERVCVIGAGSSGIAACQVLKARGIEFDCFEKGSDVGGNWRYGNDNGMSSAYRSLHINTHREINRYSTFPMPESYPDFPHHTEMQAYFLDFVEHFGLRENIRFNTEVTSVERTGGGWRVTSGDGAAGDYGAVLVANGHHWDPNWPDYPGEFSGQVEHAHYYRSSDGYEDRNVLVVGFGNSSCDIAVETSRVSRMTYLSVRRGAHVVPKYLKGEPITKPLSPLLRKVPAPLMVRMLRRTVAKETGPMTNYGLPEPDHKLGEAHPTVSNELLGRIGHGRITPKPDIERLEGDSVRFVDGSTEQIDRIVYGTGYRITFPFLSDDLLPVKDNRVGLYAKVVPPRLPGLYFIGLVQPLGALPPLAEAQSEWAADLIEGLCGLPSPEEMEKRVEDEAEAMRRRYVTSPRHTIQVDYYPYLRQIEKERKRRPQAAAGGEAPVKATGGSPSDQRAGTDAGRGR